MKKLLTLMPLVMFLLPGAFAQDVGSLADDRAVFSKAEVSAAGMDPLRYTIDPGSVRIELVSTTAASGPAMNVEDRGVPGNIVSIINIANKIWKIIKENAPVVESETKYAAAVPEGASSPNQLCEWKGPKTYEYRFSAKNLYGGEVVSVSYKVVFSYGGKFDGKGAYLTGVTVVPGAVNVSWGYKLFMSAFVPDTTITNIGTYEDPKAAMQLKLSSKISTPLKEWDGNSVYLINGGGELKEIVSPFKSEKKLDEVAAAAPLLEPEKVFNR
jgi:hypothetical protein